MGNLRVSPTVPRSGHARDRGGHCEPCRTPRCEGEDSGNAVSTLLYEVSDICEKHGILNVADIPFEKAEGYVEISRRDFLNLLTEVYHAGIGFEKERKYGEY